jgi:hypothetical protein
MAWARDLKREEVKTKDGRERTKPRVVILEPFGVAQDWLREESDQRWVDPS